MGREKVLTLLALIFLLFGLCIGTVWDAIKYPGHTGAFNMTVTDYLMSKLT